MDKSNRNSKLIPILKNLLSNTWNTMALISSSTITCPKCTFSKTEVMPTDSCQFFYECTNCKVVLTPIEGDCCVFCSYGDIKCPPIQLNKNCCS